MKQILASDSRHLPRRGSWDGTVPFNKELLMATRLAASRQANNSYRAGQARVELNVSLHQNSVSPKTSP